MDTTQQIKFLQENIRTAGTDSIFICGGTRLLCNSNIIAVRCPKLYGEMKTDIPCFHREVSSDVPAKHMLRLLNYLQYGEFPAFSNNSIWDTVNLYAIADKYDVGNLKEILHKQLADAARDPATAGAVYESHSNDVSMREFKDMALEFMISTARGEITRPYCTSCKIYYPPATNGCKCGLNINEHVCHELDTTWLASPTKSMLIGKIFASK